MIYKRKKHGINLKVDSLLELVEVQDLHSFAYQVFRHLQSINFQV